MNIALIGYGKMGQIIEDTSIKRGHNIVFKGSYTPKYLPYVDVAMEFSIPSAAFPNISICLENKIPVICGTTGWLDNYLNVEKICLKHKGAFLYASNFSIGVNLLFALNRQLAKLIAPYREYEASIQEIHHVEKIDAPSGTAITLASAIFQEGFAKEGVLNKKNLLITSKRFEQTTGKHIVNYCSPTDKIYICHKAFDRSSFAVGAVMAAEWIQGKSGIFSMKEVLNIPI